MMMETIGPCLSHTCVCVCVIVKYVGTQGRVDQQFTGRSPFCVTMSDGVVWFPNRFSTGNVFLSLSLSHFLLLLSFLNLTLLGF